MPRTATQTKAKNKKYYSHASKSVRKHIFFRDIRLRKTRHPHNRTMEEFKLTPKKVDELFDEAVKNGEDPLVIGSYYRNLKNHVAMRTLDE